MPKVFITWDFHLELKKLLLEDHLNPTYSYIPVSPSIHTHGGNGRPVKSAMNIFYIIFPVALPCRVALKNL